MNQYEIVLKVKLDDSNMPESISWDGTGSDEPGDKKIKAFLLSMFDEKTKDTLKIDLWTKDFEIMEMDRLFYNTLRSLCDTYNRSTQNDALANEMRQFTRYFGEKTGILTVDE